jgi:GT2 family glycosyltransferase
MRFEPDDEIATIHFPEADPMKTFDEVMAPDVAVRESALPEAKLPSLSAIICTHKRYKLLSQSVQSLLEQDIETEKIEIIVVDNSGHAEQAQAFSQHYAGLKNVRFIHEKKPGLSNARNIGAHLARAPIVAYIDDDAIAAPNWASEVLAAFEEMGDAVAVVGGPVRPIWLMPRPDWLTAEMEGFFSILDYGCERRRLNPGEWLVGCNLSFRREFVISLGGFSTHLGRCGDLSLLSNEENHLIDLIRANAKAVVYAPSAIVDHQIDGSRTNADWLKRRMAWQAVSDILSHPDTALERASITSRKFQKFRILKYLFLAISVGRRKKFNDASLTHIYEIMQLLLCIGA